MVLSEPLTPHARARDCVSVADRIGWILDRMVAGQWNSGREVRDLSTEWGLSVVRVQQYVTEASRAFARMLGGKEEALRAELAATARTILEAASVGGKFNNCNGELSESPDLKTALQAVELQAKLFGLLNRSPGASARPPDWEALTPEEKRERLAEARAKLEELENDL